MAMRLGTGQQAGVQGAEAGQCPITANGRTLAFGYKKRHVQWLELAGYKAHFF